MDAIQLDNSTLVLIALAILAIMVVIVVWVLFRRNSGRLETEIEGPGVKARVKASTQPPPTEPAITIKDAKSYDGGVDARDETGRGANLEKIETKGDIKAIVTAPPDNTPPKT